MYFVLADYLLNIRDCKLKSYKINCYKNAIANRVNGILKDEFFLDQIFYNTKHSQLAVNNAIKLYNNEWLHLSLDYKTPNSMNKKVDN